RSTIFYHTAEQENIAKKSKQELNDSKFQNKIVTEIVPATTFYPAEDYHQKYYQKIGGGSCYN
ncbi:MAG: peptide-methionine (S)-S-oxide reductase, partial [Nitrososphaeraceae archaeon]